MRLTAKLVTAIVLGVIVLIIVDAFVSARRAVALYEHDMERHAESSAEARSYFPDPDQFALGPEEYLEHVRKVKQAVSVPVIGSLNGFTHGGWLDYAKRIEEAGADALELHIYSVPTNPGETGEARVQNTVDMVSSVRKAVTIPLAAKLSPFAGPAGRRRVFPREVAGQLRVDAAAGRRPSPVGERCWTWPVATACPWWSCPADSPRAPPWGPASAPSSGCSPASA